MRARSLLAVACLLLAAACTDDGGGTSATAGAVPGRVVVTVAVPQAGAAAEPMRQQLARFSARFPAIGTRLIEGVDETALVDAAIAGDPPDLAWLGGIGAGERLCASGILRDLDAIAGTQPPADLVPEGLRGAGTVDGRRCGVAVVADAAALYVNLDLAQPPAGPSDLILDGLPAATGGSALETLAHAMLFSAPLMDGDVPALTDPRWLEVLQFEAALTPAATAVDRFVAGRAALVIDDERLAYRLAAADDPPRFAVLPVPAEDADGGSAGPLSADVLGVPAGAAHPAQALRLVRFLLADRDAQVGLAGGLDRLPASVAAMASGALERPPGMRVLLDVLVDPASAQLPPTQLGPALLDPLDDLLAARNRLVPFESQLAEADRRMAELLAVTDPG
jgi:multiple sugar transport system substrate-binding protein